MGNKTFDQPLKIQGKAIMKNLFISVLIFISFVADTKAQLSYKNGVTHSTFIDYQKTFQRPEESFKRKEDTLQKQFEAKNLIWPAKYIYIRSFKYDSQLEVWVKDEIQDPFKLFKTYKVCALAGTLGPKRLEGDYQVPEGFYYINEFNPRSEYYLSLGINYPNVSDRILSDSLRPGSAIYIHGSCVTVGCIPIMDQQIDELYILAAHAKNQGQDYIPVHIFPIRFNVARSIKYLDNLTREDAYLKKFAASLEGAFNYFEKYKQLPVILINEVGEYTVNGVPGKKLSVTAKNKKAPVLHRTRNITGLVDAVHEWPKFPGGGDAFMDYLDKLGKDMFDLLPVDIKKAYVQVEFIVDKDGIPTNIKVLRGMNDDDFNNDLISRLEKMPVWKPAILHDKPVPKKMIQTITIGLE